MRTNILFKQLKFHELLLEYYKKLNLSENDLAIILMIDHLLKQDNKFITAEQLSVKMSLPIGDIDKELVSLLDRKFIEYKSEGNSLAISLEPTNKRLYREFRKSFLENDALEQDEEKNKALSNIYQEFEKELKRPLAPLEFSMINEWVNYGFSDQTIIDALKEALSKNKKSLRSVDKILLKWQTSDDRKNEGYSTANGKWDKDVEEAIKIANTDWIDK